MQIINRVWLILSLILTTNASAKESYIWWEGENPQSTNFPKSTYFDPQNDQERDKLSGGRWLTNMEKRKAGSDQAFAIYSVTVPEAGKYHFWTRKFWKHGPFRWRFGTGDWQTCGRDIALADGVELRTHLGANWVYLGDVDLKAGEQKFELRLLAKENEPLTAAFDAFILTPTAFFPSGKLKPGEKSGLAEPGRFSVEPAPDDFSKDALLDLRSLNEQVAGASGYVFASGSELFLATQQAKGDIAPVRFFAVNVSMGNASQSRDSVDYLARKLAKLGVNMVRFHSPLWGEDLETIDKQKLDDFQYLVSAMKKQGIYTHLSFYFPLWVNVKPSDGIAGYESIQNKHPFGLIYFDQQFQQIHRGWIQQIMTAANPYGNKLSHEPALAIVELVNEDSLFFWTFSKQNIPDVQWKKLEKQYGGPILPAWDMTQKGIKQGGLSKLQQMQKQVKFLANLQRDFYKKTTDYLKTDLGYRGLVVASNWKTADDAILHPIERWTYQAGDIIDKHGYFNGEHDGQGSSWSVRVGHTYKDRSGLRSISKLPVHMIQEDGFPSMISEIGWTQPNQYRAEFAPLVAAVAGLQGIDNITLFAMGSNYVRDTEIKKFQLASPSISMTFPASALMYRRGDVRVSLPTYIEQSEADIFSLTKPAPTEAEALDALRATGQEIGDDTAHDMNKALRAAGHHLQSGSGFRHLVRIAPGAHKPLDLQTQIGVFDEVMTIDTPRSKAAIGFLGKAGPIKLGNVTIDCKNEYAVIMITSLDDKPIETSEKVLITAMTDDRPYGFAAKDGTITSLGQYPFTVANIDARVDLGRITKRLPQVIVLDENGMPRANADPKSAVYTLWMR